MVVYGRRDRHRNRACGLGSGDGVRGLAGAAGVQHGVTATHTDPRPGNVRVAPITWPAAARAAHVEKTPTVLPPKRE